MRERVVTTHGERSEERKFDSDNDFHTGCRNTAVTNIPFQVYTHLDEHSQSTYDRRKTGMKTGEVEKAVYKKALP